MEDLDTSSMKLSFQKLFYVIATVFSIFAFMIFAKTVLIPLAFALLVSFILLPVANRFELWGLNRTLAALLSILIVILMIVGGIFLFSNEILNLSQEFFEIRHKIALVLAEATLYINKNLNFLPHLDKGELVERLKNWLSDSAGALLGQTFSTTAAFLTGLFSTIVFTFLILIYRTGFTDACTWFFPKNKRASAIVMFNSMQQVGKKYLLGMITLMIIVGLANSIGLWILGIDNPFLFGFLAGVLAIVPYIGTTVGAAIPVLYTFISYDSFWMPIAVVILFWLIQTIENNFLSPKIVGGSLKINALAAILSIIVGGVVWAVVGMILFLPFASMLKVVCVEYESLKPIGLLMGEYDKEQSDTENKFFSRWWAKIKSWPITKKSEGLFRDNRTV